MIKKKINIGLILVAVCLWGVVSYRVVKNYFFLPHATNNDSSRYKKELNLITKRDTFTLTYLKHDPFLNKEPEKVQTKKAYKKVNNVNHHSLQQKKANISAWPFIECYGFIKSNNSAEVYLIKLNNNIVRLKKGETKMDITLKKTFKDSIIIAFQKEERAFSTKNKKAK